MAVPASGASSARHTRRGRSRRAPEPEERQRDAERSRQALLAAALDEFAAKGFAGARVTEIADRAGVNKQLINYYFESKEGLYLALQRAWLEREERFAAPEVPLAELALRYLADTFRDPRPMLLLLWRGLDNAWAPPDATDHQEALEDLRRRQAQGELAGDLDPAAVLLATMAMVAAPVALPQVARELFGADPTTEGFQTRYADQLQRILEHLGGRCPHSPAQPGGDTGNGAG